MGKNITKKNKNRNNYQSKDKALEEAHLTEISQLDGLNLPLIELIRIILDQCVELFLIRILHRCEKPVKSVFIKRRPRCSIIDRLILMPSTILSEQDQTTQVLKEW